MDFYKFDDKRLPGWLKYPEQYIKLLENSIITFLPWYLLDETEVTESLIGLKKRYPDRQLFPFAKRDDCDDIACWEKVTINNVTIIHDFASRGFETKKIYPSFWDWYREAMEEMINFED